MAGSFFYLGKKAPNGGPSIQTLSKLGIFLVSEVLRKLHPSPHENLPVLPPC